MIRKIAIVRERGQLTMPDQIRRLAQWTRTSSAVVFLMDKSDEIKIIPHESIRKVEWEKLRSSIESVREIKGKGKFSNSEYIRKNRE